MKKFYVKCFVAVAMLFMTVLDASAYKTHYDDLAEAQKDIETAVFEGMALKENCLMTKDAYYNLKDAVTKANAVYDSPNVNNLEMINEVMPDLLKYMEEAQPSIELCKGLPEMVEEFLEKEKEELMTAYDSYDEKGNTTVCEALDELYGSYDKVSALLCNSETMTEEIAKAYKNDGKTVRELLEMVGFTLPTVQEAIDAATGIHSVENAVSDNAAEYNLAGAKVQAGYKGIVIKGGKKIIRR